jgi:deazaflavin-dependent oxidoreductase (nitroreductase family)
MAVIFAGATLPDSSWSATEVLLTGVLTGVVAGATLGLVSGWFLPSLDGPAPSARLVLHLLGRHHPTRLRRALVGLEVIGRRSGRPVRLPVQFAVAPGGLAVVPGQAVRKTWWRNIVGPTPVRVLRDGVWTGAEARLLRPTDDRYAGVRRAYERRWPSARLPRDQPVVLVRMGGGPSR